jgi:hypothetical protein
MKRLSFLLITVLFVVQTTNQPIRGQIRDFGNFIAGGADDAEKLFTAYMTPYINGFAASLTGGWYNTANPHKLGGFNLTLVFNSAFVPADYKTFNVDDLGLTNLVRMNGTSELSPTGAGKNDQGPYMRYNFKDGSGNTIYTDSAFALPPGTSIALVPSAMIQAGIGLIKGTEIDGRFLPKLGSSKAKVGLWGIGLKHDIKQWIPGLSKVPVLNISVMGGYSKMNAFVNLDVTPYKLHLDEFFTDHAWDNQKMVMTSSSFTANLLVSADLPIVCFYGGVGFATTKTNIKLQGDYPMVRFDASSLQLVGEPVTDPIDFQVSNKEGSKTKPRLNAGVRLKLALLTLNFDYTRAKYNMATFGIGLSFR